MALRFPPVDVAPMSSPGGQISPPGSRHKSGGWRALAGPLRDARAAAGQPNGPEVWNALLAEFAAELRQAEASGRAADLDTELELDDAGAPWIPRLGGRVPLGAELLLTTTENLLLLACGPHIASFQTRRRVFGILPEGDYSPGAGYCPLPAHRACALGSGRDRMCERCRRGGGRRCRTCRACRTCRRCRPCRRGGWRLTWWPACAAAAYLLAMASTSRTYQQAWL